MYTEANEFCISRERIEELSRSLDVPVLFPDNATAICYYFIVSDPDTDSVRDLSALVAIQKGNETLISKRSHVLFDEIWFWVEVLAICVLLALLACYTLASREDGDSRPELSVGEVASLVIWQNVRLDLRDLARRGECHLAKVDGTEVVLEAPHRFELGRRLPCSTTWLWFWAESSKLSRHRILDDQDSVAVLLISCMTILMLLGGPGLMIMKDKLATGDASILRFIVIVAAPIVARLIPWLDDVLFGRWLVAAAAGMGLLACLEGGLDVVPQAFCALCFVSMQVLWSGLKLEGVRVVAGTRRWVRRKRGVELTAQEREDVLLYAEAVGMGRRFLRDFPASVAGG
jgi:hypothetical protein